MTGPEMSIAQRTVLRALDMIERLDVRHIAIVWSTSAEDDEGNAIVDDGYVSSPDPDWLIAAMLMNAAEQIDCGKSTVDDDG